MDPKSFQKTFLKFAQSALAVAFLFSLTACDPVVWYGNDALMTSKVTNEHEITQKDLRATVRLFRFAKQTIVEIGFESVPKDRLTIQKTDVQILDSGAPLENLGFVDHFNEASVKKYKTEDLQASVPVASDKKIAVVFANTKSKDLDLHLFGTSYKFTVVK